MTTSLKTISPDFPFQPRYIGVDGHRMHYIDEGTGDPILFLHGNPTSSYLWRNIIPHVAPWGRCIAVDLIGMGRSDKPDLRYDFFDHARYLQGFIEALHLTRITLVIHDWGSALGFNYAMNHEANIKAIAFMEAIMEPATWASFPKDFRMGFRLFRTPVLGWLLIVGMNLFLNGLLPQGIVRRLTPREKAAYHAPYPHLKDRNPLWRWPNQMPIDGRPTEVARVVDQYSRWFKESNLPKLLFYGHPGAGITPEMIGGYQRTYRRLQVIDVGKGIHFLQEDQPHAIGTGLAHWYRSLS